MPWTYEDHKRMNRERMRRVRGSKSLDEQTYAPVAKGRRSERIVEKWLNENGFEEVQLLGGPFQPDISCVLNGKRVLIEVKSAIAVPLKTVSTWYTDSISKGRINDDFVAIVLPNDEVCLYTMAEHLAACGNNKARRRSITTLVRERCPEICRVPEKVKKQANTKRARAEIVELLKSRGGWPQEVA